MAGTTGRADWSFLTKLIGALLLAGIGQALFVFQSGGSTIGGFALLLILVVALVRPALWRNRASRPALAAAILFALVLAADPGPLALLLYWTMLTLAALLVRAARFGDGWRWTLRLIPHGVLSPFMPLRDLGLLNRARDRRGPRGLGRIATALALPIIGTILFVALFAAANPLIENFLMRFDARLGPETIIRLIFAGLIFLAVWSLVRPPRLVFVAAEAKPSFAAGALPGVTPASVILSLIAFNLVFALQNGLDLAFLWSGAPLPGDLTLAGYAHRGAYPLIATALLAGLFVLVTLRPGSDTARSGPVRLLVTLWIAQNLLLVASTIYRTFDYIESYSLTGLRIAALLWMGLVAIGLVLICYRLLRAKSAAWLINANMLAALLVLTGCTVVDLDRMAAGWNVRHAREVGGRGVPLDLCYLNRLGSSALLPLLELETRPDLPAELRDRVQWVREKALRALSETQADWHGWTLRGESRLAAARSIVAEHRLPAARVLHRDCHGREIVTPPPAPPAMTMETDVDENMLVPEDNAALPPLTENEVR
ncbi:MAG TPA: DUF4173 domain-containing protein [Allosphingosinicella sp.]|nr:DUF4173 domain-containing protein [Allosphingosinicella sp.]